MKRKKGKEGESGRKRKINARRDSGCRQREEEKEGGKSVKREAWVANLSFIMSCFEVL